MNSKKICHHLSLLLLLCLVTALTSQAQQLAFPGAEGFGRFTTGGRGGAVYEVTNLDDSGPGSLREGINASGARTIVFKVAGTINLLSELRIRNGDLTIAGQTAPGGGICTKGYGVTVDADNVIIRYMRFRPGDVSGAEPDAIWGRNHRDIIIDHCSMSWAVDETSSFYDNVNFTMQWCLLSESLYRSTHAKGNHGYGGIWGGQGATFHHNMFAHQSSRTPRFNGSRYTGRPDLELVDYRNNVNFNWGGNSAYGGEGGNQNMVNNYYKAGPATTGERRYRVLDAAAPSDDQLGRWYVEGNFVDGFPAISADNWNGGVQKLTEAQTQIARVYEPFRFAPVETQTAEAAYESILSNVGAVLPRRDPVDSRIIHEVSTGTVSHGGIYGEQSGMIDSQDAVGGWPELMLAGDAPAPADDDHDGMPNNWETSHGLNPNDPSDRNRLDSNGFTMLENYMNSIIGSPSVTVIGNLSSFYQGLGTPSAMKIYSVSGRNLTGALTITPPANFEVSADGGTTWRASAVVLSPSNGTVSTTIGVRLNASALGSYAGSISHTTDGTDPVSIAVNGRTSSPPPAGTAAVVALDGSGQFTSVQAAINAAPTGRTSPYIIYIKNGKYKEKVTIPSNKPFIHLVGESVANTILVWDDYNGKPMPGGGTYGTSNSATVTVNATDFFATRITFENAIGYNGDGPQALAINVNADRATFEGCRFIGGQDTVLTNGDGRRHYFKNCYIDGNTDFIFGAATAVFEECVIFPRDRVDGNRGGYVTAANTSSSQDYGYVFRDCRITVNRGVTSYTLGRPWQNDAATVDKKHNKTVFLNTKMGSSIRPEGWSVWNEGTNTSLITYAEYKTKNFDGSLHDVSQRVSWSKQLTDEEAVAYYDNSQVFGSWDPCSLSPALCAGQSAEIAVSNFRGKKGTSTTPSLISWNISWPMAGVKYELFRSTDKVNFEKINEQIAADDISVNFTYSDATPPAGNTYTYYVKASKEGLEPHITEVMEISSTPTILTTGTLNSFVQGRGTPSSVQAYAVSGVNLTQGITITPPVGYEVSADGGTTWFSSASPLVLSQTNSNVANTTITVRLNATTAGTYEGSIVHTSAGATEASVAVSGTTSSTVAAESVVLQHWPMVSDNAENSEVRSSGVTGSVPSFRKLYVSNGTTVTTVPAYSTTRGQAFSPSANGDGSWSTASGGTGGNLNRTFYEQFTVTASEGYAVRVDSVLLKAAFYNTSSNTKLAVIYSKTGFVSDSANVTGGTGLGAPLLSTANGGFTTPVLLANQTGGTTNPYAFALAGAEGVMLQAGETLTIRMYFSCGSTSPGRYAMVKDVKVKGGATLLPVPTVTVQHWPLATDNQDDAAARAVGVKASSPTFGKLYLSNGTTVPTIPAYSAARGQAFGATANGDGMWTTASGGPGGNLNRNYYQEFTVTATEDYAVKVDSIALSAAFYNTSSNTKLAVSYSRNGFATDFADVTGGTGPTGPMLSNANGGFTTPVLLPNQTGGPTNTYTFALAGADGVTLNPGETLTIRMYFSCGSSSSGRYAMLKDVKMKGSVKEIKRSIATVSVTGGTFTYDGTAKAATGFAYGTSGVSEVLSPAVTLVYKTVDGEELAGAPTNTGTYTAVATFAGNSAYKPASATATITIGARAVTVTADAASKQWSDPDPALTYQVTTGSLVNSDTFTGTLSRLAGEDLGTYTIHQGTLALNSNYNLTLVPGILTITKEDARVTFTGSQFVSTSCATCSSATVTLSATIQDITATDDAVGDAYPGDIRKAKVRFVNRDNNIPVSEWLNVGLVNSSDGKTGTATFNWNTSIGANDADQFTIGVEVDNGYYFRNNAEDNVVITVAKPLNDFVVGGGFIHSSSASGLYAADAGKKTQFGFNVKYNKSGKNLQGRINVILSRKEADGLVHVYQIKGNAMTSLSVNSADPTSKKAVFNGKASMQDITNPETPVAIAGNLTLQVSMTDKGQTGANDGVGITVWSNEGGLFFTSSWTGTTTAEVALGGGNISVSGGSLASSAESTLITASETGKQKEVNKPLAQISPVPSSTYFTLVLQGDEYETAEIKVYDLAGRKVEQFKGTAGQSARFGDKLKPGTYLVEIWQGGERTTIKVVKQ